MRKADYVTRKNSFQLSQFLSFYKRSAALGRKFNFARIYLDEDNECKMIKLSQRRKTARNKHLSENRLHRLQYVRLE